MSDKTPVVYGPELPDLMTTDDYTRPEHTRVVKFRIVLTEKGVEILGDSPSPHLLEALLEALEPHHIEMMLCG